MNVGDTWILFRRAHPRCHFTSRSRPGARVRARLAGFAERPAGTGAGPFELEDVWVAFLQRETVVSIQSRPSKLGPDRPERSPLNAPAGSLTKAGGHDVARFFLIHAPLVSRPNLVSSFMTICRHR
jgi:hypothetical protein